MQSFSPTSSEMKVLTLLFLNCLLLGATAQATIDPQDVEIVADPTNGTFLVRTMVPLEANTTVEVTDRRGAVIYTLEIKAQQYLSKRFRLDAFPSGYYQLELRNELVSVQRPFSLDRKGRVEANIAHSRVDGRAVAQE